ncbi:MAG: 3-phosphoshikimate 1-carboxyvinyltransferase [Candidatus Omnitrophica bacterium]|nr:3-phosphoshikimate 1-carboxyvinyltransferase [Candidatus Omnitrophota bacterium]
MYNIKPISNIKKGIAVPPDKSISHRAIILSSLSNGSTRIEPFLKSDDTLRTLDCMERLGITANLKEESLTIVGAGLKLKPKKMPVVLFAGQSGTTMRILSGTLCCQRFPVLFEASALLERRPMERLVLPLQKMGAKIKGTIRQDITGSGEKIYPPLFIEPAEEIRGGEFELPIASAQVKSALMLAALYAKQDTIITEPYQSRDHTERMLKIFGGDIKTGNNKKIICKPVEKLISPKELFVPGDFSSAAFFIVLGLILEKSELTIKSVNINPTRIGLLNVLKRMGADITIKNKQNNYEPYADITVKSSHLRATIVEPFEIPLMIDEVPVLCIASAFAKGTTEIRGIKELRVKETDRIRSIMENLDKVGVRIHDSRHDNDTKLVIEGGKDYTPASTDNPFESNSDHRTAMSLIVFAKALKGVSSIDNILCIDKSFPQFISLIESLS